MEDGVSVDFGLADFVYGLKNWNGEMLIGAFRGFGWIESSYSFYFAKKNWIPYFFFKEVGDFFILISRKILFYNDPIKP